MALTKTTSWLGKISLLLLCAAAVSCSSDGGDSTGTGAGPGEPSGMRGTVLASLGENVVVPAQEAFATQAAELEAALQAAVDGSGTRETAQVAWRDAVDAWQAVEMMQFGPAGSRIDAMGGQGIRDRIYTWPTLNLCLIDQLTVGNDYDDPDALDAIAGTPRGLGVVEYLLFTDNPDNNCTPLNTINADDIWESLQSEIPTRRLGYAAALSSLIRGSANDLVNAWSPAGGNFAVELSDPTRGGAVYGSAQEGLNAISDAMFYLDQETKDVKLAEPIGISGCTTTMCPDAIESRWAFHSKENLLANLSAFQLLFLGGEPGTDGLGYDDLLVDMGASDVASDMADAISAAITATEAIPGTLNEAITNDPDAVVAAHTAVQGITNIFKSDFLTVLDLETPGRADGDND